MTATTQQPTLVYDGDCGFCLYSVQYWQKLTGEAVLYRPYQEVAANYPTISIPEFQKAVQYISPEGNIAHGAEASFLTLNHAPQKQFWLTLYRKLPGFAYVTEKAYTTISTHRSFFYRISLWLWGRTPEPPAYDLISWLFLRALGLIFLCAFISFASQALGLIGSDGILPLQQLIQAANQQLGPERYWYFPMIFWFNASDIAIQCICWGGVGFSVLLMLNRFQRTSLIFLYLFYTSLVTAGQTFMSFQWDTYLLATSFFALILTYRQLLGIWLLRWLLFCFMFDGGMVKISSGDATWQQWTALQYHFLTQPLPTRLAWYASHLPTPLLMAGTAATLFIELVMPFLIFFPRRLRFLSAFAILLLQTCIFLTGNYNFFNLLTILLCLTLLDDAAMRYLLPKRLTPQIQNKPVSTHCKSANVFFSAIAILTILLSLIQFQLRYVVAKPAAFLWIYQHAAPLRLINPYGPFAVMTTKRMEIMMEGSMDGNEWRKYEFKYKPGDLTRPPQWATPHQPRLDWQMWFAALGKPDNNPWFYNFVQRLLENSVSVTSLLASNPFPDAPPKYVRARFYDYQFTTSKERQETNAWWTQKEESLYLPPAYLKRE